MSTIKVNTLTTLDGTGNITVSRPLSGSGASLTNLPAANLTGTLPAISATNLTNLPAANLTGTLPAISGASLTSLTAANLTGALPAISGASLTNLPAGSVDGITSSANATAISISANEEVTMPLQPCFLAYNNTTRDNITGAGTVYTIPFNVEVFDQNSDYNLTTYTFTAPVTGKYSFDVSVWCFPFTGANTDLSLKLVTSNRSIFLHKENPGDWGGGARKPNCSIIVDMDAADTAYVTISSNSSSGADTIDIYGDGTGNLYAYFSGKLVA
jgi:hypothetical protein